MDRTATGRLDSNGRLQAGKSPSVQLGVLKVAVAPGTHAAEAMGGLLTRCAADGALNRSLNAAALFALLFVVIVIPPLIGDPDLLAAITAGFVNPYATGYSLDTIMCWVVLTTWVVYEAKTRPVKHGWIAPLLGLVPGVATGFAVYLLLRLNAGTDK